MEILQSFVNTLIGAQACGSDDQAQNLAAGGSQEANDRGYNDEETYIWNMSKEEAMKLIGKGGQMVKAIGKESKAFLKVDPDSLPATVRIAGSLDAVNRARAMIYDILRNPSGQPRPGDWSDEEYMRVSQADTKKLVGKAGSTINYIEKKTWAKIKVGRDPGPFVLVKVTGSFESVEEALSMMSDAIDGTGEWATGGSDGSQKRKWTDVPEGERLSETLTFQVETYGKLVGRAGSNVKRVREQSGADVKIDKTDAHVEVQVTGSSEQVKLAKTMVNDIALDVTGAWGPAGSDGGQKRKWTDIPEGEKLSETLTFEVQMFGKLVGRAGSNVKRVREQSGADVKIDKTETHVEVQVAGSSEQVELAKTMVNDIAFHGSDDIAFRSSETVTYPKECMASIIGAQGKLINEVRQRSGAAVSVQCTHDCSVRISGTAAQMQSAKGMIEALAQRANTGIVKGSSKGNGDEQNWAADEQEWTAGDDDEWAPFCVQQWPPDGEQQWGAEQQ